MEAKQLTINQSLTEIQRELLIKGYEAHCDEIRKYIHTRLHTDMLELYNYMLAHQRKDIKWYCASKDIDKLDVDEDMKRYIALELTEINLKKLLTRKGVYDSELKSLGIEPIKITNGIEQSPWLKMFNSPVILQWWTKNTNQVLSECDHDHKLYDWVVEKIELIKSVWGEIDPYEPLPDITRYWQVYNFEVPQNVRDFLVKPAGN
ncbi:MAG: hypothetical protein AAFQ80_15135 [Cyanobacteria bacterium J06621_8]